MLRRHRRRGITACSRAGRHLHGWRLSRTPPPMSNRRHDLRPAGGRGQAVSPPPPTPQSAPELRQALSGRCQASARGAGGAAAAMRNHRYRFRPPGAACTRPAARLVPASMSPLSTLPNDCVGLLLSHLAGADVAAWSQVDTACSNSVVLLKKLHVLMLAQMRQVSAWNMGHSATLLGVPHCDVLMRRNASKPRFPRRRSLNLAAPAARGFVRSSTGAASASCVAGANRPGSRRSSTSRSQSASRRRRTSAGSGSERRCSRSAR